MEENNFEINEGAFTNAQIHSNDLPRMQDISFEAIPKAALYVNLIITGIIFLILLLIASIVVIFVEEVQPFGLYGITGILLLAGFVCFVEWKGFQFKGFALREHDIAFREGWLWKSTIIVPYNRVQHIEVNQGPIDKLFDLASINIFTAGGSSSDLEISGLTPDQAANIKSFIISKTNKNIISDESEE